MSRSITGVRRSVRGQSLINRGSAHRISDSPGLPIERDLRFEAGKRLSACADEACCAPHLHLTRRSRRWHSSRRLSHFRHFFHASRQNQIAYDRFTAVIAPYPLPLIPRKYFGAAYGHNIENLTVDPETFARIA